MKYIKILSAIAVFIAPSVAVAQVSNPYGTAIQVNDRVITNYELFQRSLMMQLFGVRGDTRLAAQNALIDERLYLQAGEEIGIDLSEQEIQGGMDEFAARGSLSTEQLIQLLGSRGIAPESFRAFIVAGLTWRNVVRARFVGQANVTDDDIDAALSFQSGEGQVEFSLAQIMIADGQVNGESSAKLAARLSKSIKSNAGFASAARKYSTAPSARAGGRLGWVPSSALPTNIAAQLLALEPGQVTGPISMGGNIALFQLRGTRNGKAAPSEPQILTYTTVAMPSQQDAKTAAAKARVLRAKVDTCLDMRAAGNDISETAFSEGAGTAQEIPSNVAVALANLDPKETSTMTLANGQKMVVMLCSRSKEIVEGERENLRSSLFNQKVTELGAGYLQELKGDAFISYK